jgi:hypothetical protein
VDSVQKEHINFVQTNQQDLANNAWMDVEGRGVAESEVPDVQTFPAHVLRRGQIIHCPCRPPSESDSKLVRPSDK